MKIQTPHSWFIEQHAKGWQRWFAWWPVQVSPTEYAWLETVEYRVVGLSHSDSAQHYYRKLGSKYDGYPDWF